MTEILINLDGTMAPRTDKSLLELISLVGKWPLNAICCTQERDGEIVWWDVPAMCVLEARNADYQLSGLLPHIGFKHLVHQDYYLVSEQEVVADDWETAVITYEQYKDMTQ